MNEKARDLHEKSLLARESGDFVQSLTLNDQAIFAYDVEDDNLGFAEGIANRSITIRDRAQLEEGRRDRLLILAKHEMKAAVEIAEKSPDAQAIILPLFELGKVQGSLGEYKDAAQSFKKSLETYQQNTSSGNVRQAQLADMKVHLAVAEYKSGDDTALQRLEEAVTELEMAEEADEFSKDVWLSGGYMRLAEANKEANQKKAEACLSKAKEVIDNNPKLILRREQWEKLAKSISS